MGLYRLLAGPAFRSALPWQRLHVWFGDERCVPPEDPDSNYRRVLESGLTERLAPERLYRLRGEDSPEQAARDYAEALRRLLPSSAEGTPVLDLILLGLGTDGHVASLFPGTAALAASEPVSANYVPKLETWRLTLTLPTLNAARRVWLLTAGEAKASVVARALDPTEAEALPVQRLAPAGEWVWFLDRAAASGLTCPDGSPETGAGSGA